MASTLPLHGERVPEISGELPDESSIRSITFKTSWALPFLLGTVLSDFTAIGAGSTASGSTTSIGFVSGGRMEMPTTSRSRTTTRRGNTARDDARPANLVGRRLPRERPPTHPGEMLLEEFIRPLGVTQSELAVRLGISFPRLNEIVRGKRGVTPDTALRLARVLGMPADFWLGLQLDWDLWHAMHGANAAEIAQLKPLRDAGA